VTVGDLLGDLFIVYLLAKSRCLCCSLCWSLSIVWGPNPIPSSDSCYYDTATKRYGKVYTPTVGPNLSPTHYTVLNVLSPPHTLNTVSAHPYKHTDRSVHLLSCCPHADDSRHLKSTINCFSRSSSRWQINPLNISINRVTYSQFVPHRGYSVLALEKPISKCCEGQ